MLNQTNQQPVTLKMCLKVYLVFSQTWGCRYWTVQKLDTSTGDSSSNVCTLKKWKGQLVHKEGYISGSLPSACCEYFDPKFADFNIKTIFDLCLINYSGQFNKTFSFKCC